MGLEKAQLRKLRIRQSNLETADAMFKDAFLVKRTRFAKENPGLTDLELDQLTAAYFKNLPNQPKDRKQT